MKTIFVISSQRAWEDRFNPLVAVDNEKAADELLAELENAPVNTLVDTGKVGGGFRRHKDDAFEMHTVQLLKN